MTCGVTAWKMGDLDAATRWYEAAQRLSEHEANTRTMASVAGNLGFIARERSEFKSAVSWAEKQLAASERMQHRPWIASALQNLGVWRLEAGDVAGAERSVEQALVLWTELRNGFCLALCPVMLAFFAMHRGDQAAAVSFLDTALDRADEHDVPDARLDALWLRAQLALESGDASATSWVNRFRSASDGSERRSAQLAGLEVMTSLLGGGAGAVADAFVLVQRIRAAFDGASPLPEVHELPIAAMVMYARACEEAGDAGSLARAAETRDAARGWLVGRPHRLAPQLTAAKTAPALQPAAAG